MKSKKRKNSALDKSKTEEFTLFMFNYESINADCAYKLAPCIIQNQHQDLKQILNHYDYDAAK